MQAIENAFKSATAFKKQKTECEIGPFSMNHNKEIIPSFS